MKILLATDGSPYSDAAVMEVIRRPWPAGTHVKVLTVAVRLPLSDEDAYSVANVYVDMLEDEHKRAIQRMENAAQRLREQAPGLCVEELVLDGSPKEMIIEEAERWGADLVVLGSHGYGRVRRFLLGSVSQAVALHAPCSVEIIRCRRLEDGPEAK
jgi:nucleotide-binding universal stress UspA family protein